MYKLSKNNEEMNRKLFQERLNKIVNSYKSTSALARDVGVSEGTLRKWMRGESEPRRSDLVSLATATQSDLSWLITGIEFSKYTSKGIELELYKQYKDPDDLLPTSEELGHQKGYEDFAMIPHLDVEVSVGHGREVFDESEIGRFAFRKDWLRQEGLNINDLSLVTVRGDSMEPTIQDGSLVLVDRSQQKVNDDAVYVMRVNNHLVAKRLQIDFTGGAYIRSDNVKYEPQHLDADQVKSLHIVGRVVWAAGKI